MKPNLDDIVEARAVALELIKGYLNGNHSPANLQRIIRTEYWGGCSTDLHYVVYSRKISVSNTSAMRHETKKGGHTFYIKDLIKEIEFSDKQMCLNF